MPETVQQIPLSRLHEDPQNPRRTFGSIAEFAETIEAQGLIEPVILRPHEKQGEYWVVAGARRLRAHRHLGKKTIDSIVREMNAREALEQMVVENEAREGVSPIELAQGYQRLIDEHGLTADEVAKRVGSKRSTVYAATSLLKLPQQIQDAVLQNKLTADGARAFVGIDGERLQLAALTEALKLAKPGEPAPSRAVIKMVQNRFRLKGKGGRTKHQREVKEHGEEVALRKLVLPRLLLRVGEDIERSPQFKDEHLRTMAAAIAATGPDAVREVFQRHGIHAARLGKVSGSQLRKLVYELVLVPFVALEGGEYSTGTRVVARAHGQSLAEIERGVAATAEADKLFTKE